jgi:hypothetical protein
MPDFLVIIVAALVLSVGIGSFLTGMLLMIRSFSNNEVGDVALQTTRLVQKGLAEDVAGLVGNATNLMETMNQLAEDRRGASVVLLVFGTALMIIVCIFVYFVYKVKFP